MADVGHELGAIRHIVDSPLSSKVAMFNKVANQHNASQLLNPFANVDGRASPKPSFSKDEYGKPIAGSLTEMRGQKANIHVCKEMLELCQIINSEGFPDQDNPELRIIFFGDLFNIYNYISDKVVGLLLRARKHKLVDFEGEMLFQRRDDEVPIFLMKPIREIRSILEAKQEEFRRSVSPAPKPTTVLQDQMKRANNPRSAPTSKQASPQPEMKKTSATTSVTSLSNGTEKPPTGKTLSRETMTNDIKPVENTISEKKINLTPVIINIEGQKDANQNIPTKPVTKSKSEEMLNIQLQEEISNLQLQEENIECKSLSLIAQTSLGNNTEKSLNVESESEILTHSDSDMSFLIDSELSLQLGSEMSMVTANSQQDMTIEKEFQLQLQPQPQTLLAPAPISYGESDSNNSLIKDLAQ